MGFRGPVKPLKLNAELKVCVCVHARVCMHLCAFFWGKKGRVPLIKRLMLSRQFQATLPITDQSHWAFPFDQNQAFPMPGS